MSGSDVQNPAAKEVVNYRTALWHGYELVEQRQMLTTNMIIDIQAIIEDSRAGIRKLPGTVLMNAATGETVYTPPSGEDFIRQLLSNLEQYIHDDSDGVDPLIKLAVIHYQFESIHPFYDGNGRTGRIIKRALPRIEGIDRQPHFIFESVHHSKQVGLLPFVADCP